MLELKFVVGSGTSCYCLRLSPDALREPTVAGGGSSVRTVQILEWRKCHWNTSEGSVWTPIGYQPTPTVSRVRGADFIQVKVRKTTPVLIFPKHYGGQKSKKCGLRSRATFERASSAKNLTAVHSKVVQQASGVFKTAEDRNVLSKVIANDRKTEADTRRKIT